MDSFGNEDEDSQKKLRRGSWTLSRHVGDNVPKLVLQFGTVLAVVLLLFGFFSPSSRFGKGGASSSALEKVQLTPLTKGLAEASGNVTSEQARAGGWKAIGELPEPSSETPEEGAEQGAASSTASAVENVKRGEHGERGNERGGNEVSSAAADSQVGAAGDASAAENSSVPAEPGSTASVADTHIAGAGSEVHEGETDGEAGEAGGLGKENTVADVGKDGAGVVGSSESVTGTTFTSTEGLNAVHRVAKETVDEAQAAHDDASEAAATSEAEGAVASKTHAAGAEVGGGSSPQNHTGADGGDVGQEAADGSDSKQLGAVSTLNCTGRTVYSYKLPLEFNLALVELCKTQPGSKCPHIENEGMGKRLETTDSLLPPGKWFDTKQDAAEVLIHALLLKTYGCLTRNPDKADLFHIPYYAGLDYFKVAQARGLRARRSQVPLGPKLAAWLKDKRHFRRRMGADHFMVVGGPAALYQHKSAGEWAAPLLELPALQKVTKLLLDWAPGFQNTVAIPHPTKFHPKSARDIKVWQRHIDQLNRERLVSYAGYSSSSPTLKRALARQCQGSPKECSYVDCAAKGMCHDVGEVVGWHASSTFCLLPPGYALGRQAIFDAMVAGCIPVSFDNSTTREQYPWHLPADRTSFSVAIAPRGVVKGTTNALDVLRKISAGRVKALRRKIIYQILPNLLYKHIRGKSFMTKDAFDLSIDHMVEKARKADSPISVSNI